MNDMLHILVEIVATMAIVGGLGVIFYTLWQVITLKFPDKLTQALRQLACIHRWREEDIAIYEHSLRMAARICGARVDELAPFTQALARGHLSQEDLRNLEICVPRLVEAMCVELQINERDLRLMAGNQAVTMGTLLQVLHGQEEALEQEIEGMREMGEI